MRLTLAQRRDLSIALDALARVHGFTDATDMLEMITGDYSPRVTAADVRTALKGITKTSHMITEEDVRAPLATLKAARKENAR